MKKYLTILSIFFTISSCSQYYTLKSSQEIYEKTTFDTIDIKNVKDGTYTGYYDMLLVNALVRVTVSHGIITKLDLLEHRYNREYNGSGVVEQILKNQSLKVDGISGATYSSKSILKATERALKTGIEN